MIVKSVNEDFHNKIIVANDRLEMLFPQRSRVPFEVVEPAQNAAKLQERDWA